MATVSGQQAVGLAVTLSMIIGGIVAVTDPTKTYYCAGEDSVKEFIRLSSTGQTGYDAANNKDLCAGGKWVLITEALPHPRTDIETNVVDTRGNGRLWTCDISGGEIGTHTDCYSGQTHAELGEIFGG